MKKYIVPLIIGGVILIVAGVLLVNGGKEVKIDIKEFANDIIENVDFEDELNVIDEKTVTMMYDIDNALNEVVYMGSGATAEEFAIFEFEDRQGSKEALEKAKVRIEDQKLSFKDYMPKEMKKLDNAILINKGNYLIVCVTDDQEGAEKILDKYIK